MTRKVSFSGEKEQKGGALSHPNNKPMIHVRDGSLHSFSEPHIEVPIQSFQFAEMTKATPVSRARVGLHA